MKQMLTDIMGTAVHVDFLKELRAYVEQQGVSFVINPTEKAQEAIERIRTKAPVSLRNPQDLINFLVHQIYVMKNFQPEYLALAGEITNAGYESGQLQAPFFEDVQPSFDTWKKNGKGIFVYSNGSVTEQENMFRTAPQGDLSRFVDRYFSTDAVGPKFDPDSFKRIADAIKDEPYNIVFLSDVVKELDAADKAGINPILIKRPGNKEVGPNNYVVKTSFDQIGI